MSYRKIASNAFASVGLSRIKKRWKTWQMLFAPIFIIGYGIVYSIVVIVGGVLVLLFLGATKIYVMVQDAKEKAGQARLTQDVFPVPPTTQGSGQQMPTGWQGPYSNPEKAFDLFDTSCRPCRQCYATIAMYARKCPFCGTDHP